MSGWSIIIAGLKPYLVSLTPRYIKQEPYNMMSTVAFGLVFLLIGTVATIIKIAQS